MNVKYGTEFAKFSVLELEDIDMVKSGSKEAIGFLDTLDATDEAVVLVVDLEVADVGELFGECDRLEDGAALLEVELGGATYEKHRVIEVDFDAHNDSD